MPLKVNDDGVTWPASAEANVVVTSGYGPRAAPGPGASTWHAGIDFVVQGDGGRVRTPAGGQVVTASNGYNGGFGNFVVIRTATGHLEMYNHLDSIAVREGDSIAPGQELGIMGNTGRSFGAHVDFRVYVPGTPVERTFSGGNYQEVTMNPVDYLRDIRHATQRQLGVGAPPAQAPQGIDTYSNDVWGSSARLLEGYLIGPGVAARPQQIFNNVNPVVNGRASIARGDYPTGNNVDHNYGYAVLARDESFRQALVRVANKHNIPAQWLADVMHFESGLNTRAGERTWQSGDSGIGLIQFYTGSGLTEVARAMGLADGNDHIAAQRLMNMTPAEQMEWVDFYLSSPQWDKGFRTIEDLLAAIFGGKTLYDLPIQRRRGVSDINISFGGYVQRLGNDVGRRYQTSYDQALETYHYQRVDGCPVCSQMIAGQGVVTAHRGGR